MNLISTCERLLASFKRPALLALLAASVLPLQAAEPQTTNVIGRVQLPDKAPEGVSAEGLSMDNVYFALEGKYNHPRRPYPKNWKEMNPTERGKWLEDFDKSDQYDAFAEAERKAIAGRPTFKTKINEDGSFEFKDVPLSWYQLRAIIMHPKADGLPDLHLARAYDFRQFFIKKADEPLDIGTMTLKLKNVLMPGDAAPDFEAIGYDGKNFKLSDFRGKYVLMDVWATWCGPCLAEIPYLEKVHEELGGDRLQVIGFSIDEKIETASRMLDKKPSAYLQGFFGQGDKYEKISTEYGIESIPSIWLIDPEGKIVARDVTGESMLEIVRNAMAEESAE